jgi:hypothetical protein
VAEGVRVGAERRQLLGGCGFQLVGVTGEFGVGERHVEVVNPVVGLVQERE